MSRGEAPQDNPSCGERAGHARALHRSRLVALHASVVTFPGISVFTASSASCNDRWCTDAQARSRLSNPVFTPDAAEGGMRVRLTSLWSCVYLYVACGVEQGGTEKRYCKPSAIQYSVSLGTGSHWA